MKSFLVSILKPFASLRLTVFLLALSLIVVFAGTWAQIDEGIWQVQKKYFHSFFLIIDFRVFLPRSEPDLSGFSPTIASFTHWVINILSRLQFPMLGGYSLIVLLLLNLLAAHTLRFKFTRKRAGVLLIHGGLILMIVGEVITSVFAVESQMIIDTGETVNYSSDSRSVELAIIDSSPEKHNNVALIPGKRLKKGGIVDHPELPFEVEINRFYVNSSVLGPFQADGRGEALATAGSAKTARVVELDPVSGTEATRVDIPSAFVTLRKNGENLGTYLVSLFLDDPQEVTVNGKTYGLQMRFTRYYKPYTMKLIEFRFDRFTGTNTPRNFSSLVRLIDPEKNVDREIKIWMNHPLRYRGETFYQSSFDEATERKTVLQVVRNPGWLLPYISCAIVSVGMLVHFGGTLMAFFRKRAASQAQTGAKPAGKRQERAPVTRRRPGKLWPGIVTAFCVLYLFSAAAPPKQKGDYDLAAFGRIPVSYEGRVMPMDSLARNSLKIISGKSELFVENPDKKPTWIHKMFSLPVGDTYPATWWLVNTMAKPKEAAKLPFVRIDHPDILSQLELDRERKRFSIDEVMARKEVLEKQAQLAFQVEPKKRDLYQKKVMELVGHINLFYKLAATDGLYLAAPTRPSEEWQTVQAALAHSKSDPASTNPGVRAVLTMLSAYEENTEQSPATFNSAAGDYRNWLASRLPSVNNKVAFEQVFNHIEPFYVAMIFYVFIFLLICFSWLGWTGALQRTAFWVLTVTLIFHTLALAARIYMQGRPPVTNLYSSAIFIAWAAGVMCLGLELIFRNGLGTAIAAVLGFLSLIVAHNLSGSGDTMQMMQAVLDTNFWLATHVLVITLGYAATFLAGFLAIVYVLLGIFTKALENDGGKTLYRMVYGIACFAMLFSFVGTVLGGIWADQSWGRFWGWDPKENGAVMIVFWVALMLHARWAGMVQARGFMLLAIFGNAITSWSWFGTNMLGVGLHSYGFMDSAVFWLSMFVLLQLGWMALGSLPLGLWRSFQPRLTR